MKRFNVILEQEDGNVKKGVIYAEAKGEVKNKPNVVCIVDSKTVKHPSPHALQYAMSELKVDQAKFYELTELFMKVEDNNIDYAEQFIKATEENEEELNND